MQDQPREGASPVGTEPAVLEDEWECLGARCAALDYFWFVLSSVKCGSPVLNAFEPHNEVLFAAAM